MDRRGFLKRAAGAVAAVYALNGAELEAAVTPEPELLFVPRTGYDWSAHSTHVNVSSWDSLLREMKGPLVEQLNKPSIALRELCVQEGVYEDSPASIPLHPTSSSGL